MTKVWSEIAPLIKQKKLAGMFVETSFSNEQSDATLFGHFMPRWLMYELGILESKCVAGALTDFPIVITHMKPFG